MTVILSDLDGVLVDSHASIMRAWRWWGAEHGVAAEAIESVQQGRPSGEVIAALARLGAAGLPVPEVLVTPERLSRGKPDPEGYLLAARELGAAPSECVVLEDAPAGIEAGRAAGMHVVGITTTHDPAQLDAHELAPSIAAWLRSRNGARR